MFPWMCQHRTVLKFENFSWKKFSLEKLKFSISKNFWLHLFFFSLPKWFNLFFAILSIRIKPDQTWITWPLDVRNSNMEKAEWPTDANVQLGWFYLKERITASAYSRLYFFRMWTVQGHPRLTVGVRTCEIILLKMDLSALTWTNVQCHHVMMDSGVIIHMAVLHVSTSMNVKRFLWNILNYFIGGYQG